MSPFYILHGVEPILLFDLVEATFLVSGFTSQMSSEELLALRIHQLEKWPSDLRRAADCLKKTRFRSKTEFETKFQSCIHSGHFPAGDLVLVHNIAVEKTVSVKKKVEDRYAGPYKVVQRTMGGSYVLAELDGTIWSAKVAAFRLIPISLG